MSNLAAVVNFIDPLPPVESRFKSLIEMRRCHPLVPRCIVAISINQGCDSYTAVPRRANQASRLWSHSDRPLGLALGISTYVACCWDS